MVVYSGYIAPEYQINGVFSMKSDVFSFGVIVLEIITGERNRIVYPYSDHLSLLEHVRIHPNIKSTYTSNAHWFKLTTNFASISHFVLLYQAWSLWNEGNSLDLVDQNLNGSFNSDEVLKCLKLGLLSVQERPEDRPLMSQVLQMLASAETSSLQTPKQPGFAARRAATENPSTSKPDCSVAHSMTTSLFEGR